MHANLGASERPRANDARLLVKYTHLFSAAFPRSLEIQGLTGKDLHLSLSFFLYFFQTKVDNTIYIQFITIHFTVLFLC